MAQPNKTHHNDYSKTDAQLYGYDGSKWSAVGVDGDGLLGSKLYAWDADALAYVDLAADTDGNLQVSMMNQLVPEKYDGIYLTYTGTDLTTVTYKLGTTVVATLTMVYTDHVLQSVVKT